MSNPIKEKIDTLTRDFTTVIPKPKSLVRQELIELCRMFLEEVLPRYDPILSGIKKRAEELLNN